MSKHTALRLLSQNMSKHLFLVLRTLPVLFNHWQVLIQRHDLTFFPTFNVPWCSPCHYLDILFAFVLQTPLMCCDQKIQNMMLVIRNSSECSTVKMADPDSSFQKSFSANHWPSMLPDIPPCQRSSQRFLSYPRHSVVHVWLWMFFRKLAQPSRHLHALPCHRARVARRGGITAVHVAVARARRGRCVHARRSGGPRSMAGAGGLTGQMLWRLQKL